jgi:type IV pilus assembly protein PilA
MAFCNTCGGNLGSTGVCEKCGRQGAAPARKKTSPLVWILVGLGALILVGLIGAALLMPNLNRAKAMAFETGAIREITKIHTAQAQYYSQFGKYAATLSDLGPELATGEKNGYKFTLQAAPGGYTIQADPTTFGTTGSRTFYSDQSLVIHQNHGPEPATSSSPELR